MQSPVVKTKTLKQEQITAAIATGALARHADCSVEEIIAASDNHIKVALSLETGAKDRITEAKVNLIIALQYAKIIYLAQLEIAGTAVADASGRRYEAYGLRLAANKVGQEPEDHTLEPVTDLPEVAIDHLYQTIVTNDTKIQEAVAQILAKEVEAAAANDEPITNDDTAATYDEPIINDDTTE